MKLRFLLLVFGMMLIAALFGMGTIWAQGDGPGADDAFVYESEITDATFVEAWTLDLPSADRIGLRVERVSGNLLPTLRLLDGNGTEVANSYGPDRTGAAAEIADVTLPAPGTYQIEVSRERGQGGLTIGAYRLRGSLLASAPDSPANSTTIGEVKMDTPLQGEITAGHWRHLYDLAAFEGDVIRVTAERISLTLLPEVEILDSNGVSLRTGYINNSDEMAQIESFAIPGTGQYTVVVSRERDFTDDTVGGYKLSVELIGAGETNPILERTAGTVSYDTLLEGEITQALWYEDWDLVTEAGDTLTITVQRLADPETGFVGNLQPEVILLGGNGQELRRGYVGSTGAGAMIERYALDGPGTYTVRVTRNSDKTGVTFGRYVLSVALVGSGEGSPNLAGTTGVVTLDMPVAGELTNARWADSWTLAGEADQQIDLIVTRTEGTLIPRLDILDSNNQSLRAVYPEQTQDVARIERFRLPSAGEYRIVVFRLDGQNGYTTGGFELLVQETPTE